MSAISHRILRWTVVRIVRIQTISTLTILQYTARSKVELALRKLGPALATGTIRAFQMKFSIKLKRQIQKCSHLSRIIHLHRVWDPREGRMHLILPVVMPQLDRNWPWKCPYLRRRLVWLRLISGTDLNNAVPKKLTISAAELMWPQSLTITCVIVVMINIEIALVAYPAYPASPKCPEPTLVTRVIYLSSDKIFTGSSTNIARRRRMIRIRTTRPLIWARTQCQASWACKYHANRDKVRAPLPIFRGSVKPLIRRLREWASTRSTMRRVIRTINRQSRPWNGRSCSLIWPKCKRHSVAPSRSRILIRRRTGRVRSRIMVMLRREISKLISLIRQTWWLATHTVASRSTDIQLARNSRILSNWLVMERKQQERLIRKIRSRAPSSPNLVIPPAKVPTSVANCWAWRPWTLT